jgi:hypothetical protein
VVGIIFIGDLKYCPYLKRYTDIFDSMNIKYEVLYWNREATNKKYPDNYIGYKKKSKLNKNLYYKFFDFLGYKLWLNKKLKTKEYKKLIILSTLAGIINYKVLVGKFKGKYIFDIRDYSYECIKIFYRIEKNIIKNSYFTCISSEGFKIFLPKEFTYVNVHNFNNNDIKHISNFNKKNKDQTLNLVWMGAVRYFIHQKKIINRLKNDSRFNMIYHGSGADLEDYKKYCRENKVHNIIFTGEYNNEKKHELITEADIINNSYMTHKVMEVKYAISNKFYDGIIHKIPQLVETNTFKHEKVRNKGLGIGIDPDDDNFADKLFEYYHSIDEDEFNSNCINELNRILEDDELYTNYVANFINYN